MKIKEHNPNRWPQKGLLYPARSPIGPLSLGLVAFILVLCLSVPAFALKGTILQRSFTGPITNQLIYYNIYLPEGYYTETRKYPVIYHLHGLNGSQNGQNKTVSDSFERARATGLIGPIIIIFPNGYLNSMWGDSFDGAKPAETNLVKELIPHVDQTYRTIPLMEYRIIQGMSMGGFGAAKFAVKFPDLFSGGLNYDGALHTWQTLNTNHPDIAVEIFNNNKAEFDRYSPWTFAVQNAAILRNEARLRSVVGALLNYNRSFHNFLQGFNIPDDYIETTCAHNLGCLLTQEGQRSASFITKMLHLVGCWPMDEGQGAVTADQAVEPANGTLQGGQWANGKKAGSVEFDGADDFIDITDGIDLPDKIGKLQIGTISVWFRFDRIPGPNQILPIFYLGDGIGGAGNSSLIIEIGHFSANSKLYFTILDDNKHIPLCFDSGTSLLPGAWYHFAAVVGPDFNTGYLNGSEMTGRHYNFGGATIQAFFSNVVDKRVFWLGRGFLSSIPGSQFFDGRIDEVKIHNRPLNAAEIKDYYIKSFAEKVRLTLAAGSGGTTVPVPGTYVYAPGTEVTVTAQPETTHRFDRWNGDFNGSENPLTFNLDSDKTLLAYFAPLPSPPLSLQGTRMLNRSLSQRRYIDSLSWQANPKDSNITLYRVYRNDGGKRTLLFDLTASVFEVLIRGVYSTQSATYIVTAIDSNGFEGLPASITVR